jgi:hypothetical protein
MSETVQAKLEALRAALIEGEQSGSAPPFDFEAFPGTRTGLSHSGTMIIRLG